MLRPSLLNSASRRAIGRNLALDLLVAVGLGVTMALVSAILPTVARRGGLAPLGLSALAAAPFIANLLGAFAGRVGPRTTAQLTLTRGIGAASLLVLFLVPPAPVLVAVSVVFWLSLSFGGPFHLRLCGAMYPARLRGRVVGALGMGRAAAGALAAFGGGILADRIGGERAVAAAGLIGVLCAIGYVRLRASTTDRPMPFSAAESCHDRDQTPLASRAAAMSGWNALTGARGIAAAFLMSALLQLGIVDVTIGLQSCAAMSAAGVVLFARAGRVPIVRTADHLRGSSATDGQVVAPS